MRNSVVPCIIEKETLILSWYVLSIIHYYIVHECDVPNEGKCIGGKNAQQVYQIKC